MCGETFKLPEYTCRDVNLGMFFPCKDIAITNQGDTNPLFDIENLIYLYNVDDVS